MNQQAFSLTKDPVWPWSLPAFGVPALILVAILLVALTVWTYAGTSRRSIRQLIVMLGLRLGALALTFLMLLRPSVSFQEDLRIPSTLLVALDGSESMTIQDEYNNQSRWDALLRLLRDCEPALRKLTDDHNIAVVKYKFGAEVKEFDPNDKADGKRTDFGQMLRSLYDRHGGEKHLRGLLVLSDGADNGALFPALTEAAAWRSLPCPISTFSLGQPTTSDRQRDIALVGITSEPAPVPIKGKLTIRGTLDAPGFEGAKVNLRLLIDDKEALVQQETLAKSSGNEVKLVLDAPAEHGEIKVTLKVDPLAGEMTTINNEISTYVTVTKEGISVLLVDKPRLGEPGLIIDALKLDSRIRVYVGWAGTDDPAQGQADLFQFDKQRYDVIIIGDVPAKRLTAGNRDALEQIKDHVKKGAGLLMMGGYQTFANSDWDNTPIADLLPVRLNTPGQIEDPVRIQPTPVGLAHFLLRLKDRPAENSALWNRLPELTGMTKLGDEKPGASVLAIRAGTKEPMMVAQDFGKGRSLAFAGDTTWRWQILGQPSSRDGIEAHARFWKQVVLWLSRQDEAEGDVIVKPDKRRMPAGSKLGFSVALRGKGGETVPDATYKVAIVDPSGAEHPVSTIHELGDRENHGSFLKTDLPGEYRFVVRASSKDNEVAQPEEKLNDKTRFLVYQNEAEMTRRAADHAFLIKLANAGGGKYYRAQELPTFLKELQAEQLPQDKPKMAVWPDWRRKTLSPFLVACFLLFVGLLSAEWIARRRFGMV